MTSSLFDGLCAFPPTPMNADGIVDTGALAIVVDRLAAAKADSIGLLGSTGAYAYLDRVERDRAVAAAVETVAGRVPLVVGVGALRTARSIELASRAERLGADGLLLAPMSYLLLTEAEVSSHVAAVAASTGLPLCIYDNPDTTRFAFEADLVRCLAALPNINAVKLPPSPGATIGDRSTGCVSAHRIPWIGYSGDWQQVRRCSRMPTRGSASSQVSCLAPPCS